MQEPHLQMLIQSCCQSRCMLCAAAGLAMNRTFYASCLRGLGHFHKVANQAKASNISAGSGPMVLQNSGCLRTALLHAAQGTCHAAINTTAVDHRGTKPAAHSELSQRQRHQIQLSGLFTIKSQSTHEFAEAGSAVLGHYQQCDRERRSYA